MSAGAFAGPQVEEAAPPSAMQVLIEQVESQPGFNSETLVQALLRSGPHSYDELTRVMERSATADGRAIQPGTFTLLDRARAGIPAYVDGRRQQRLITGRRLELESRLALRVIGDVGTASDLSSILEFVESNAEGQGPSTPIGSAVEDALTQLLRRDQRTYDLLTTQYAVAPVSVKPLVLRAVGACTSDAALEFLAEQLDGSRELKPILLAQLGRVAEAVGSQPGVRATTQILMELQAADPAVRREACLALGRFENHEALGDLIGLLAEEHAGVASAAHWALERISGKQIEPDAERWLLWWSRELTWWNGEADELLEGLHSGEPGKIAAALRQLGSHRLYRHELAREMLHLLQLEQDALVAQTCAVLAVLRSRVAEEALKRVADEDNPATSPHAERALASLAR